MPRHRPWRGTRQDSPVGAKEKIGEDTAALLGALLVVGIGSAAFTRADRPPEERRNYWEYLDEFHTFATLSLATMLSLRNIQEVTQLVVEELLEDGQPLPTGVTVTDEPVVAVHVA